jgi:hypothetical protein
MQLAARRVCLWAFQSSIEQKGMFGLSFGVRIQSNNIKKLTTLK